MALEEIVDQRYTKGGDDQDYYEDDYYPNDVDRENALLRQQLDEALRANQELSQGTEPAVTKTSTVQTESQARTSPVTRQAARAAGETQTQASEVPTPQGIRQPPSSI